jgi:hypothetical protein
MAIAAYETSWRARRAAGIVRRRMAMEWTLPMDSPAAFSTEAPSAPPPAAGAGPVFILGAPRSGTTWLAKIFDSHPDVLYRNEPDTVLHEPRLPLLCPLEDIARYRDIARDYIERLLRVRSIKSAGSLPVFAKRYEWPLAHPLRLGWIYALHVAAELPVGAGFAKRLAIPDLIRPRGAPRIVVKSVNARGLARLFLEAVPACRIIFILRHPCGQIASVMRGLRSGEFAPPERAEILATDQARRFGLDAARFGRLSPSEQWAWHWAILNQKAHDELGADARVRLVRYEDVATRPEAEMRALFGFCGLSWDPASAAFLARSTTYSGKERYYRVMRNALVAAEKWRTELPAEEQRRILAITRAVPVGRLFGAEAQASPAAAEAGAG